MPKVLYLHQTFTDCVFDYFTHFGMSTCQITLIPKALIQVLNRNYMPKNIVFFFLNRPNNYDLYVFFFSANQNTCSTRFRNNESISSESEQRQKYE